MAPATDEDEVGNHPDRRRALAVACVGVFLLVVSLSSLNVALAEVAGALDADIADLQWIVDSYAVTFAGLLLAGGALGDRIGRRKALTIGFAVIAGSNLLAAFGGSVVELILMRAVAGVGAAVMMPATLATVSEVFSDRDRPRAIAAWSSIAAAGGAFGPFLGGWMVTIAGWQAVFVMTAGLGLVGLVGARLWVPYLAPRRVGRFDIGGAVLSIGAVGSLVHLVIEGPVHPVSVGTAVSLVGALGFTAAFIRYEAVVQNPLLPLELFEDRERVLGASTLTLAAIGFNGVFFVGALLIQIGWGESGLVAGLLLVPIGVVEVVVANGSVQLARRFGMENMISLGLLLMAAGYLGMGLAPSGDRWWFVLAGIVAGVGNGLAIPLSIERIVGSVEPSHAGVAASVNDMSIELGASLGIGLLGAIQRLWFEAGLPDGVEVSLADVSTAADRDLFRTASLAAFVLAAAVAVVAVPIARASVGSTVNR